MNATDLPIGTAIYSHGNMSNVGGKGTVTENNGTLLTITLDNGSTFKVPGFVFSRTYRGNGSTPLVTLDAYRAWHREQMAKFYTAK